MAIDMSKYLGVFVAESTEHLEAFGSELVQYEKERSPASIDSMFRHAHSVKGMAASMGFEATAQLAHRMEDLVAALRQDASRFGRDLVDLLLASTDALMSQVRAAGEGAPLPEAPGLLAQLAERVAALTGKPLEPTRVAKTVVRPEGTPAPAEASPAPPSDAAPHPSPAPSPTPLGAPPRFQVKVRVAPSCPVPGVRGFLVYKRLGSLGNVFDLKPPLEDLKAGRLTDGLIALELETTSPPEAVQNVLKNVVEVELVSLQAVSLAPPPVAPPPPAPAEPDAPAVVGHEPTRTVRVKTELLDYFLDAAGELLLATARIRELSKSTDAEPGAPLEEAVDRLHGLVKDLHAKVMKARMTPLAVLTDRMPRVARDIARRRERDVDLVITGADIELDRAIIDELSDPLLHLLRNCIDHGIEPAEERAAAKKGARGRVLVSVRRTRDRVQLEIEDDGRGMDAEKLKAAALERGFITQEQAARMSQGEALLLSCLPGVSTAKDVSDISGRGVGMDAVKRVVENVGGTLEIESERGRGTRFVLKLPLTVAVLHMLLVAVGEETFGLPIAKVSSVVEATPEQLTRSREAWLLPHEGNLLPVHALGGLLELPSEGLDGVRPYVVMEAEGGRVALAVDRLVGQEEGVLKALTRPLDLVPGLAGVTILGTGRPVFILDVPRLLAA